MEHGARSHAKYSASNAHRILRCPGQVALASRVPPRPDSDASIEGERAHELLQRSLLGEKVDKEATPEMLAAFEVVHDFLDNLYIARGPHLVIQVEQPFTFPQRVVPAEDAAGIADIMVIDYMDQEAWSIDFKYGEGVAVEAERNPQLLFNAVGRLWRQPIKRINCVVIQPRITHHRKGVVRQWSCGPLELAEFQMEMEAAIEAAERAPGGLFTVNGEVNLIPEWQDHYLKPGPWCRWCDAEMACPVRERHALATAFGTPTPRPNQIEGLVPPDPATLGMDRIAHILRHSDMLISWLRAVENYAKQQVMSGVQVPGHKLVEAQARRQWHGTPEEIAAKLIELSGFSLDEDDVLPRDLLDITKAEARLVEIARKSAPKGKKDAASRQMREALAFLTLKQSSGNLVLVPDTDSRPAVNRIASAFAGVVIPPP
jgi:hypothetical protein